MTHSNQPSLFDYTANQPYPLLAAEKWGFQLDYYDVNGNPSDYLYHAVQWTLGLGASDETTFSRLKDQLLHSTQELKIELLPFESTDGKTYQVFFIDQKTCYMVAMAMRVTKNRPQLQDIRDYLAKSGEFVDWARRNPQQAIENLTAHQRKLEIEKAQRAGYGQHPAIEWKKEHDETLAAYHDLRKRYSVVCDNPHYGDLTNAEYKALFGEIASSIKTMLDTKSILDALPSLPKQYLKTAYMALDATLAPHIDLSNDDILRIIRDVVEPLGDSLKAVASIKGIHHITEQPILNSGED